MRRGQRPVKWCTSERVCVRGSEYTLVAKCVSASVLLAMSWTLTLFYTVRLLSSVSTLCASDLCVPLCWWLASFVVVLVSWYAVAAWRGILQPF